MDTPGNGFRRAATASWVLAAAGVAGVVGASVVAYADTVAQQTEQAPADPAQALPAAPLVAGSSTSTSAAPSYSPHHTQTRGS